MALDKLLPFSEPRPPLIGGLLGVLWGFGVYSSPRAAGVKFYKVGLKTSDVHSLTFLEKSAVECGRLCSL
jgi:hypothetical protein